MNTHDPLCDAPKCQRCFGNFAYCSSHECVCAIASKVRADERERIMSEGPYFTSVVHDCCVELQKLKGRGEA
jgi:hypothetical protein